MSRLISISSHATGNVVPAYTQAQIDAMLAGDFSGDIDPVYVDARSGEPLAPDEVRRRLATARASRPVFNAADTRKVAAALAAHERAQTLMTATVKQPEFQIRDGVTVLPMKGRAW